MSEAVCQAEMPRYQCHKKVWALKISGIKPMESGGAYLVFENTTYADRYVFPEWVQKHNPQGGGYFVVYDGGYESYSPADAFESGYSPI